MTLIPATRGAYYASGVFSSNSNRIIKGANVFFQDADTGLATEMDSITLEVVDNDGDVQYLLTTASTPAILLEVPDNVYVVDEIDVTGFTDGDITLSWTGTYDGYEYTAEHVIAFDNAPDMVFVSGATDTLEDFSAVIDEAKTYTVRARDTLNNPIDGYNARLVFLDTRNGTVVERVDGTLQATGSGLWKVTKTLTSPTYAAELERYEVYWEMQLEEEVTTYFEITHSRHPLKVFLDSSNVTAGPMTYNTNESLRRYFPQIDKFLEDVVPNQAEREILLNQKRLEASHLVHPFIKNARIRVKRDLIEMWEAYETYRLILLNAHAFAKFAVDDGQVEYLDRQIKRIKGTLFSPVSTVRIGGRVN